MTSLDPEPTGERSRTDPTAPPSSATVGTRVETAWIAVWATVGLLVGLLPLNDNSFLTHLTTGRGIVRDLDVPRVDPYTFTSPGEPWVVQSWLASTVYGGVDEVLGGFGLRLLTGVLMALLAAMVWRLSHRAESLLPRLALSGVAIVMGITVWSERPLLMGLVAFTALLVMVDGGRPDARWALPLFFVWANVHGSFPLGLVLLGTLVVGAWLDRRPAQRPLALLGWGTVGAVLGGVINPYGIDLLLFPLDLLSKREQLQHVAEWQTPNPTSLYVQLFVLLVALGLFAVVRGRRWSTAVPLAVFAVAAVLGARNVALAAIVIVAVAAPELRGLGSLTTTGRSRRAGTVAVAAATVAVVLGGFVLSADDYRLDRYPVEEADWLVRSDGFAEDARWAHSDSTGNYLTWRFGGSVPIFMDDRMELHPLELVEDYVALNDGDDDWSAVLDRWEIDGVLWPDDRPLAALLADDPGWRLISGPEVPASEGPADADADEAGFVIACRAGTERCRGLAEAARQPSVSSPG